MLVLDIIINYLVSCILGLMGAVMLYVLCYIWRDGNMLVHGISDHGDSFAHGEGGEDRADSKTVDVT